MTLLNRLTLTCGLCAALSLSAAHSANAQDVPPTAAAEPAPDAPAPEAVPATTAAPAGDLAAEVAALRSEVDALKAKAEEAETAALLAEEPAAAAEPEMIRIYGFMDFGLDKFLAPNTNGAAVVKPTTANTFVFGNLNLYVDASPIEHLRILTEFRLTLSPHGEETSVIGGFARIDTTAFDFSSPSSQYQIRQSGIYIERAWSQYEFSKAFKLQWGMFLTPFGIWNLDHGSPTLISLILPTFIASQMVPTRLLGLHGYGSFFSGNNEIGYAIHLSNGRTPTDFDFTEDKAVGARAFWAYESDFGRFVLGASGYVGRYVDQKRALMPVGKNLQILPETVVDYWEEVLGFDVALDVGGLRIRAESVLRWIDYKAGAVERGLSAAGTSEYLPNRTEWSGYALAAYRTPWRLEPYLSVESSVNKAAVLPGFAAVENPTDWHGSQSYSTPNSSSVTMSVGINVELTTHTQLKTQLAWAKAYDRRFEHKSLDVPFLYVRLVDSF